MVSVVATLMATCAITVAPAAAAPPPPLARPLPSGPSAFTAPYSTENPAPAVRERAIANARKALWDHPDEARIVAAQQLVPRNVVVDPDGAAHVRFDRKFRGLPVHGGELNVPLRPDGSR